LEKDKSVIWTSIIDITQTISSNTHQEIALRRDHWLAQPSGQGWIFATVVQSRGRMSIEFPITKKSQTFASTPQQPRSHVNDTAYLPVSAFISLNLGL
jgi:hypothetical protein